MKKGIFIILIHLFVFSFIASQLADASARNQRDQVERILQNFKNYRYGAVSIYEVKEADELKDFLKSKRKAITGGPATEGKECLNDATPEVKRIILRGVEQELPKSRINDNIITEGFPPPTGDIMDCIYQHYLDSLSGPAFETVLHAYIVTTRPSVIGSIPDTIIGVIFVENEYETDTRRVDRNLRNVSDLDIFSVYEMHDEKLDENKYGYNNLYDLAYSYFIQGNVESKMMEARSIGTDVEYFAPSVGNSTSLIDDNFINSEDIQRILRVSYGQSEDYYAKNNELIISPDLVRWTNYETRYEKKRNGDYKLDSNGRRIISYEEPSNKYLPKFGLEMRYGIPEINYNSLWSERMTVSALWQNVKLGIILPTNGWSNMSKEVLDQNRKLTHAGVGLAGSVDFPFKVIPKSGIFHFSFGYVFGDAVESEYKNRNLDPLVNPENRFDNDYVIRASAQLHYTFGMVIDENYQLRFGIGGTVYELEKWYNKLDLHDNGVPYFRFSKLESETIGGISASLEFMGINPTTPYGASLKYFDEALAANLWLNIPIVENMLSMKFDLNAYFTQFRKEPHPWENESLFTPMVRFIVVF